MSAERREPVDYLRHVVIRKGERVFHAVCLRCGLRLSAPNKELLKDILQSHSCTREHKTKASSVPNL